MALVFAADAAATRIPDADAAPAPGSTQANADDRIHALERSDPAAALAQAEAAAAAARLRGASSLQASALLHGAHALRLLGRHGEALLGAEQARAMAVEAGDERVHANALAMLAVLHEVGGLQAEALSLHQRALDLFQEQQRPDATASTLLNLGNLFEERGDLDAADAAYRKALQIKRDIRASGIGAALGNLGLVALRRGRAEQALDLLRQAEREHAADDPLGAAIALRNQSTALGALGRLDEAEDALRRADALVAGSEHVLGQSVVAEGRADVLALRAGEGADPARLRAALRSIERALQLAAEADSSRRVRLLRKRADLHERLGNASAALAALRESERLQERDRRAESDRRYAVLSANFDSARQREHIEALQHGAQVAQAQLSRQRVLRNSLLAGAGLLALVAVLLYGHARQRRRAGDALVAHNRALAAALAAAERERGNAEEAERINRELLRVAAEELRVPLSSALGSAERLLTLAADQAGLRRDAAAIADTLQHLVHVVGDLVESAELERQDARLARQEVDLAHLLRGVSAHCSLRASEKRQELVCQAPDALPVLGDPARLREALEHLVGNALKFTPLGKRIDVMLALEGSSAVVRVRDQGPGLREHERGRVFGKLQRAGTRPTGSEHTAGLGLWLVKRIAELHGGSVEANPSPAGEGSEFVLRIPAPGGLAAAGEGIRRPGGARTDAT